MTTTERLALLITADTTNAVAGLNKLGATTQTSLSGLDKLKAAFGQLGAIGVAGGIAGAGAALGVITSAAIDFAKAAEQDARAQALLESTLRNTTSATNEQIKGTDDYITKLSLASTVADDQLRPALATLVRSTGDLTSAQKLLGLSLDVSAGTGADLGSVSDALAKALQGNTKSLKSLTPELGKLIKDGASANEILAKLSDTYKGQSAEFAKNNAFGTLTIALQETKEEIGKAFLPAIQAAADLVRNDFAPAMKSLAPAIEGVTVAINVSIEGLKSLAAGIGQVSDAASKIIDPFGVVSGGLFSISSSGAAASDAFKETASAAGTNEAALKALNANVERLPPFFRAAADAILGTSSALHILGLDAEEAGKKVDALKFGSVSDSLFGVSRAQDAFQKAVSDTTKSTGNAGAAAKDYERKLRSVDDATRSLTDAQVGLRDAELGRFFTTLGASSDEITSAQIAERDSTRSLADAQRTLADSQKRLNDLRNVDAASVLDAQAAYIQAQRDFVDAERSGDVVALDRAKAGLIRTEKALADAQNPSAAVDLAKAQQDVQAAQDGVTKAAIDQRRAHEDLNETINRGKLGSKELADADKKLEDAQRKVDDSARNLADAQAALTEKTSAVSGSTQTATDKFYAGITAADTWLQTLKDNNATPGEFASAIDTIEKSLQGVASAAGETAALDDYLNKIAIMAYAIAGLRGQLADPLPRLGFIDTSQQKPGTPYLYGGASAGVASDFSATVTLRLKGDAVVDSLLDYQGKNGSIPIRVTN